MSTTAAAIPGSGFVALPGAFGTADELFEILTWRQLRIHEKPIGLLNTAGFFTSLLAWLDHTVQEGFLKAKHRRVLLEAPEPEVLLEMLLKYRPEALSGEKIEPEDR